MPRAPRRQRQPTVPRACAPRVRSVHSVERYGAAPPQRLRLPLFCHSLATRAFSATPAARAPTPFTAVAALATGTLSALRAGTAVVFGFGHSFWTRQQGLHRQTKPSALIAIDELDAHAIALLDDVLGLLGALVAHLGDVDESFGARHDLDERAERRGRLDGSFVRLADDRFGGQRLHHLARALHR